MRVIVGAMMLGALGCYEVHEQAVEGDVGDRRFCGATGGEPCGADPGGGTRDCYYSTDGEGSILGKWTITEAFLGTEYVTTGPFVLSPDLPRPTGDEPIFEISPSKG